MATCPTCKTSYPDTMRLCPTDGAVLEGGLAPKDENIGRTLDGKYRLDERLSSGGMGTVYKATHLMLGKPMAVKLIKADLPSSPEVVRRFQREAKAASALNHPNIAPAYDLGQTQDGTLYIAMEYVDGPSLKQVIQAGPIPPARTIVILKQVASALALAHKHDIIHRDLKPQNIMLTKDREGRDVAKLLDFGIAKTLDDSSTQLTATGFSLGTPQYMSPEQAYGRPVDGRSDIYSLGIILYEMLVGEVPFSDPSTPAVLVKQMTEAPVPPALKRPDLQISPALAAVALKCLEKDPANRYQTADEFSAALDQAAASINAAAPTVASAIPTAAAPVVAATTMMNTPTPSPAPSQTTQMPTPAPVPVPVPVPMPTAANQTTAMAGAPAPPAGAPDAAAKTTPVVAAASPSPAKPPSPAAATPSGSGSRVAFAAGVVILLVGGVGYAAYAMGLFKFGSSPSVSVGVNNAAPPTQLASSAVPSSAAPAASAPATPDSTAAAGTTTPPTAGGAAASSPASTPAGGGGGASVPASGGSGSNSAPPPAPPAPPAAATPPPVPSASGKSTSTHPATTAAPTTNAAQTPAPANTRAAASVPSTSTTGASSSAASAQPQQAAPVSAPPPSAALPANPAVAFRCEGPTDICNALKSALDQALSKDSMSSVRDAARADVAVGATVTLVDEKTQQMFGNTFTIRNYTIDVNGQARRGGENVPMPSAATLNYDARYRDRLDEKARQVAASVVESVREFWKKK